jgi:Arc/MetJ-type ribon-helix-helix transcriptional regulator
MIAKSSKHRSWLTWICILTFCFGCKLFSTPSTPRDVTIRFYRNIEAGKLDEAIDMLTAKAKNENSSEALRSGLAEITEKMKQQGGIESIEIVREETMGDKSSIYAILHYKQAPQHDFYQKLVRDDGVWKIDGR